MHHKYVIFPFSAIVGQELMKKSLILNAIDPLIGGVLIRGDKGTGKSTAVRSLIDLLPEIEVVTNCPFNCHPTNLRLMCKSCQQRYKAGKQLPKTKRKMQIIDMPLSATEDKVIGTIDIQKALREGIKALEPGILAKANRNILYIDEVNLLDAHLVNILLDAAAMGINIIEREGISLYHPARFILVGTMNPEEGELRPQILDRFGLCVDVEGLIDKEKRLKVMEYKREFDKDPWEFEKKFQKQQDELKKKIIKAQEVLSKVKISRSLREKIVEITTSLNIKTHRADIVMEKTSRALAAFDDRLNVTLDDIKEAALMALPHRIKQHPLEQTKKITEDTIINIITERDTPKNSDNNEVFNFDKNKKLKKDIFEVIKTNGHIGQDILRSEGDRGQYIKARPNSNPNNIAVDATLRKAIIDSKPDNGKLEIRPEHLMEKIRISTGNALYIILIDSSSSMRLDKKIKFTKSLAWSLMKRTYEKKAMLSLITFRGKSPEVVVKPTSDINKFNLVLENLPTGGKTPLTPAILKAYELIKDQNGGLTKNIILISDGKGNIFFQNSFDSDLKYLTALKWKNCKFFIISTENRNKSTGMLELIAEKFRTPLLFLEDLI
ncbi:MAG: VWA domain-containing protein [Promethearchaeota archaeon]